MNSLRDGAVFLVVLALLVASGVGMVVGVRAFLEVAQGILG